MKRRSIIYRSPNHDTKNFNMKRTDEIHLKIQTKKMHLQFLFILFTIKFRFCENLQNWNGFPLCIMTKELNFDFLFPNDIFLINLQNKITVDLFYWCILSDDLILQFSRSYILILTCETLVKYVLVQFQIISLRYHLKEFHN